MAQNKKKPPEEEDKPIPFSQDAERSVLGAILLDNETLLTAREILEPEDFFLSQHVHTFYYMLDMHDKQTPIDLITLTEALHGSGELETAGGAPYLASLADGMPRISNVEHYARIVKEKSTLRKLLHAAQKVTLAAFEGEDTAENIVANAKLLIASCIDDTKNQTGPEPLKIIIRDNFETLEKIMEGGPNLNGVPYGYAGLDGATGGLQPGELTVLAARPSVGKSSFALNILQNICVKREEPALLFSLEMGKLSLVQRLMSAISYIDVHRWRTGQFSGENWRELTEAMAEMSKRPLYIDDASSLTVGVLAARAEKLMRTVKLRALVVDYLQLLTGGQRFGSREQEVAFISRQLKGLAKNLGIPVLALSQLSRSPDKEDRQPVLSDLRESGAIEQDADVVMFLHRPQMFKPLASQNERNETNLIIGKQRNGPTTTVPFLFIDSFTRFEEPAPTFFQEK